MKKIKLKKEEIDSFFSDVIRNKLTDKQFWNWVAIWNDTDIICNIAENWDTSDKLDDLKTFGYNLEIIKE